MKPQWPWRKARGQIVFRGGCDIEQIIAKLQYLTSECSQKNEKADDPERKSILFLPTSRHGVFCLAMSCRVIPTPPSFSRLYATLMQGVALIDVCISS